MEDVFKAIAEERARARRVVAEMLGEEAAKLAMDVSDLRIGASTIYFYVPRPGAVDAIDVDRLVEASKKLFKIEKLQVEDRSSKYSRRIKIVGDNFKLGIICFKEARGCQAWAKIGGETYDCKMQCYGSDRRKSVALALALAYANVPPEHATPDWSA